MYGRTPRQRTHWSYRPTTQQKYWSKHASLVTIHYSIIFQSYKLPAIMSRSITSGGQNPPMNATDILCAIWASRRPRSTQMNDKDIRRSNGLPIYIADYPHGWHRHNYTEWIVGVGFCVGLENRYWVQYDPLSRPRKMVVPELVGRDVVYTPPEGYAMKIQDGNITFFIDDRDHYHIRKHEKQNTPLVE
jgi:hypothetical protein